MKKVLTLSKTDKKIALLIDPDFAKNKDWLIDVLSELKYSSIDVILIGGSLVSEPNKIDSLIREIRQLSPLPIYLFPGHSNQISKEADGILFISLISGRNPEFLIGQQVIAAPIIRTFGLNVLATGYMLIGSSNTSAHYISQTQSIPYSKVDIALATALAGEMLGMKAIFMDGGSGADKSPSTLMTSSLSSKLAIPIIIGGGINKASEIDELFNAGANMVVIGTAIEKNPNLILQLRSSTLSKS